MCTRMDKCNLYNPEAPWDLCAGGMAVSGRVVSHPSTGSVMVG